MNNAWLTSWQGRQRPRPGLRRARTRQGMSLIEVMLATAMLLSSVMVLSRMAFLAQKHAHSAEDRSMSQTYCQNIMEEMLAGARPLQSVAPARFDGDVWIYMVKVETVDEADLMEADLMEVAVTVDRLDDPESPLPKEDEMQGYRLVRWVRGAETGTSAQDLGGLPEPKPMESVIPEPLIDEGFGEQQAPQPLIDEEVQPFGEGGQRQPQPFGEGGQRQPPGGSVERDMRPEDMPPELW